MNNRAKDQQAVMPCLEYARVEEVQEDCFWLRTEWGRIECQRAAGCLLKPRTGDKVLASISQDNSYIISVLERNPESEPNLDLAAGTVISSASGDLSLAAAGKLSCGADRLEMSSRRAEITTDSISFTSRLFKAQVRVFKTIAEEIDTVAKDLTQRLVSVFRQTKEHEECQAGSKRQLVEETWTMQSKNAVVTADEDVRVDGELIHMG
ncbi:MAG: DUF3540 domain-containing protein [Thermodesulfobacteriota bacterium]